jgi:hypothetical protein
LSNHLKPLQHLASEDRHDNNDFLNQLRPDILKIFDDDGILEPLSDDTGLSRKVKYVSSKRIEIDSVMAAVNDNARFSEFIFSKLREKFPIRNYNRAINVPEYIMPTNLESLNQMIRKNSAAILEKERTKI